MFIVFFEFIELVEFKGFVDIHGLTPALLRMLFYGV